MARKPTPIDAEAQHRRAVVRAAQLAHDAAVAAIPEGTDPAPPPTPQSVDRSRIGALEPVETLLAQAYELGMTVNPAWALWELSEKVRTAQEAKLAADKAEFMAALKVWVFLLRDAFPVADEKHLTGETIAVTQDIADKWYDAGVARPGKAPAA